MRPLKGVFKTILNVFFSSIENLKLCRIYCSSIKGLKNISFQKYFCDTPYWQTLRVRSQIIAIVSHVWISWRLKVNRNKFSNGLKICFLNKIGMFINDITMISKSMTVYLRFRPWMTSLFLEMVQGLVTTEQRVKLR
jgi:hypothetical protein